MPEWGRSPTERDGNQLQYFCLKILWTEEPGRLDSMMLQRVRQDWVSSTKDESLGVQCAGPESDTTERLNHLGTHMIDSGW